MTHKNYFEIEAADAYEFGLKKGRMFRKQLRRAIKEEKRSRRWQAGVEQAKAYLEPSNEVFPELVEELVGYATGAEVEFEDLWALNLSEDVAQGFEEKCTTSVTNDGFLVAHNEDWAADSEDELCVLRRTIGDLTAFELFYFNTLGGNAISVNSHGVVQAINSLDHKDHQIGVPKNLVARWLADSDSPEESCERLHQLKRASGYHHTLVNSLGRVWSIECSATEQVVTEPRVPFVHTNHYVSPELVSYEDNTDRFGTFNRYECAVESLSRTMTIESSQEMLRDSSRGKRKSIFSNRTIGSMVLDVDHMRAFVWLRRERKKGWVSYEMKF